MPTLYTLHLHKIKHPELKIAFKHCYKDDDQFWYCPTYNKDLNIDSYEELDGHGLVLDSFVEEK